MNGRAPAVFRCVRYSCALSESACLRRQGERIEGRGCADRVPERLAYCASGRCEQGQEVALRAGGVEARRIRDSPRCPGPFRGSPAKGSPRYRALGNSMAVPVMRWIGERLAARLLPRARADDAQRRP